MTVTAVRKNTAARTLTVTAEFDATPERVWELWSDPRQLELWWGPPTFPATFTRHDLTPGGRVEYHMTGPEGEQPRGYWEVVEVDAPRSLVFEDGFLNDDGTDNLELPVMVFRMNIEQVGDGSRMTIETEYPSNEAMEQILAMGMEEGLTAAIGQIDGILAQAGVPSLRGR